ncbi:tRNA (adenine(22)-N(1))-methyltransferase TrmK [Amphritea sp. 1_MG-2023]|uniref:tRNA (adenine(22)-N(1))-methyltransferase n=1 Tax=Amphritea sp. 1_MG-2023 TaxID=3062670 RepID=UPI0026E2D450|nr:tRNA (adenine(22)-N(1))-methyltransferase TrmK [Amphritea sp. 1_MG-2023]MDO6562077.1 tRNA (adenine(22)-N(1))-methyltransferase TrmK [Amphritea sp. 1_MG-2023]
MKLSKRLQQIEQLVASDYDHIWDCCCDHGFLGAELLSRPTSATIHFVDIVPQLITQLENRLRRFYPDARERWETHCIDVATLPLAQYSGKQLIIIAGVGGDLMIHFLEAIHQQHAQLNVDLLLCPVYQQYALREKLIELNCSLKDEILIAENQRFYEAILVSSAPWATEFGTQKPLHKNGSSNPICVKPSTTTNGFSKATRSWWTISLRRIGRLHCDAATQLSICLIE